MTFLSLLYVLLFVSTLNISNSYRNHIKFVKLPNILNSNQFRFQTKLNLHQNRKLIHGGFNHCGIIVKNNEKSKQFFIEVFDFIDETHLRPISLPFPGSFLRFGDHQLHLMELPNPDKIDERPEYGGNNV